MQTILLVYGACTNGPVLATVRPVTKGLLVGQYNSVAFGYASETVFAEIIAAGGDKVFASYHYFMQKNADQPESQV